jgi:hypothetical protein
VISPAVLAEIRKAATQANLELILHANTSEAQKFGVEGNVDVLEHGMWNWGDLDEKAKLPAETKELLDQIVKKKIGYQPTDEVTFTQSAFLTPTTSRCGLSPGSFPRRSSTDLTLPVANDSRKEELEAMRRRISRFGFRIGERTLWG